MREELSPVIGCGDCQAPARIDRHPAHTVYICSVCKAWLATIRPEASVANP